MARSKMSTEAALAGFSKATDKQDHEMLEYVRFQYTAAIKALGNDAAPAEYDKWVAHACKISLTTLRSRYKPMLERVAVTVEYVIVKDWKKILANTRLRARERATAHRDKIAAENAE